MDGNLGKSDKPTSYRRAQNKIPGGYKLVRGLSFYGAMHVFRQKDHNH